MAEGYARHCYGDVLDVESAGSMPDKVNPNAIAVMKEIGVDISGQRSKPVGEFAGQRFDYVVTLCRESAKDACPAFIGEAGERLHWDFPDPIEATGTQEEVLEAYRSVRDGIREKIDDLMKRLSEGG